MNCIQYIIHFLLGEDVSPDVSAQIAYTSDENVYADYRLVIYPSVFFNEDVYGTLHSMPVLPLLEWQKTPILFGEPKIEQRGETFVLYADIIASTYFLLTRYEEMVMRGCRDVYGRFPGKDSLPYRAGFIDRPIVEEYGCLLRRLLRQAGLDIPEPLAQLQQVYLTHDADSIARNRQLRGVVSSIYHNLKAPLQIKSALKSYFCGLEYDDYFTFPFLFSCNNSLSSSTENSISNTIVFIKPGGGRSKEDKPLSKLYSKDFQYLFRLCKQNHVAIGLHASYEAGQNPSQVFKEKQKLEQAIGEAVYYNRHHYLDAREPEDMQYLVEAGITDDFTMGYADVAGFRLGTCRPVQWINPVTKQLSSLILHPLTVMDASLSDSRYMNLSESEAYNYCVKLIDETRKHGGDLCLLWHNTSVTEENPYHRKLYIKLIDYLKKVGK